MSSSLKSVSEGWLDRPLLPEFEFWIKDDIKWRLDAMGYKDLIKMEAFNDAVNKFFSEHTNREYLECSDKFTSDFEKVFTSFGVKLHDAIRLAWKWSD